MERASATAQTSGYKLDQFAPIAPVDDLTNYDAIIFGTPTRFGNMSAQIKNFIDQAGSLWTKDQLVGKVGSVFTATASQHGGQEATILSFDIVLLHLGFIMVGLSYTFKGQLDITEVQGVTPYGASTIVDSNGLRMPSESKSKRHAFREVMLSPSPAAAAASAAGSGARNHRRVGARLMTILVR
jgi:NAD(P)H dehydrogenase (quinone)